MASKRPEIVIDYNPLTTVPASLPSPVANHIITPVRSAGEWLNLFGEFKATGLTFSAILRGRTEALQEPAIGAQVTARVSDGPWQVIYGETRVGGVYTFVSTDVEDGGEFLHVMITVAGHEIDSVQAIYLDNTKVTFSTDPPASPTDTSTGKWADIVFIS